jgi:hypothetical protein
MVTTLPTGGYAFIGPMSRYFQERCHAKTFGHHDWLAIGEFPDEKAAASAVLAAAAGGSLSDVETTVAMTAKDAATTFESAGKAGKGRPERRALTGLLHLCKAEA